jgi:hypothetical protein
MTLLATKDRQEIWFQQLERPFAFQSSFPGHRYVAILFSHDETVTDDERRQVAHALFSSGCRYSVFAGHVCSDWAYALDRICIESGPESHVSDEAFTMTTSHAGQSVEDVILFGLTCTSSRSHDFSRFVILFVGSRAGLREEVEAGIRSAWDD